MTRLDYVTPSVEFGGAEYIKGTIFTQDRDIVVLVIVCTSFGRN